MSEWHFMIYMGVGICIIVKYGDNTKDFYGVENGMMETASIVVRKVIQWEFWEFTDVHNLLKSDIG